MALHVLRKITPATLRDLHNPEPGKMPKELYLDADKPWFAAGYVEDGVARHAWVTKILMDNTASGAAFAVWADGEGFIKTFGSSAAADRALRGARVSLLVDVEMPEEAKPGAAEPGPAPA